MTSCHNLQNAIVNKFSTFVFHLWFEIFHDIERAGIYLNCLLHSMFVKFLQLSKSEKPGAGPEQSE